MEKCVRLSLLSFLLLGLISFIMLNAGSSTGSRYVQAAAPTALYAWGENVSGQLGNGDGITSKIPVAVLLPPGVTYFTNFSAGREFALGMGSDGKLYAWGTDSFGQLGSGKSSGGDSNKPLAVSLPAGVTAFTAFAAGYEYSLALGNDGKLYAWGNNNEGQLGTGTKTESSLPVPVLLPTGVTAFTKFAAGYTHSVALGNDGKLYAWGAGAGGQLGDGLATDSLVPVPVALPAGVTAFTKFAIGKEHSVALGNDGKLYAWGQNISGQLGNGTIVTENSPAPVSLPAGVTAFTDFAVGYTHNLALGNDGKLYAWGDNIYGELGNGTANDSRVAVPVLLPAGVTSFTAFAAGNSLSFAFGNDGKLYAWGINDNGQIGNGTSFSGTTPVPVSIPTPVSIPAGISKFIKVSAGFGKFAMAAGVPLTVPPTTPATATPRVGKPAELVAKLRVSPDREFSLSKTGELLIYTLAIKNTGPGIAGDVYVRFPIPSGLEIGYPEFSDKSIWIEKIVTDSDQPYIQIRYPALETKKETQVKLYFRAKAGATPDATVFSRYWIYWSDETQAVNSRGSNAVRFVLTGKTDSLNATDGEVQNFTADSTKLATSGGVLALGADFYAPNEFVTFWYTDKDNQSTELAKGRADSNGILILALQAGNLKVSENYIVVGYGNTSGIYGSAVIQITAATSQENSLTSLTYSAKPLAGADWKTWLTNRSR